MHQIERFFVTAKAGQLKSELFRYQSQLSNRVEAIDDSDISNSDVWVQIFDTSTGAYQSSVTKVDNDTVKLQFIIQERTVI